MRHPVYSGIMGTFSLLNFSQMRRSLQSVNNINMSVNNIRFIKQRNFLLLRTRDL